jgi:hypothetical protein
MNTSTTYISTKLSTILASVTCVLAILLSSNTIAASSCKGISQNACTANDSCGWTKAYKKKNGSKVAAYCRAKPKKKAAGILNTKSVQKKTTFKTDAKKTNVNKTQGTEKVLKKKTTTSAS